MKSYILQLCSKQHIPEEVSHELLTVSEGLIP